MSNVFQCLLCEEKFSEQSIKELEFFPSTMICNKCYDEAEKDSTVCFGKEKEYSKKSIVCVKICIDRKICKFYLRVAKYD